ncbi:MAG: Gfo/Idh/MocA family oxidoreductase [Polyangiaceae bacterium]
MTSLPFAITGVSGYIAPRHLRAIRDTGNHLVAAVDPKDSAGVLDPFGFDIRFFTEIERFDRHLEKLRRGPDANPVRYVSVCSPNFLHDAHCRLAMRVGADAICEKPLVINPWNLDALQEIELETGRRVFNVLQLRAHARLLALRQRLLEAEKRQPGVRHHVVLSYVTARGPWYLVSWKGQKEKSGGLMIDIGIHFFDMLMWLFGPVDRHHVFLNEPRRAAGHLELKRASVSWFLSVAAEDLPFEVQPGVRTTFRAINVDGEEVEFSDGFTDLHTRIYEQTLAGKGFGIDEVRPAIDLVYKLRHAELSPIDSTAHPFAQRFAR